MKRSLRVWAAAGFAAVLAFQILSAEQGPDVGPNGENGGYTAKFVDVKGIRTRFYEEGPRAGSAFHCRFAR
jgi:hypothetical protein